MSKRTLVPFLLITASLLLVTPGQATLSPAHAPDLDLTTDVGEQPTADTLAADCAAKTGRLDLLPVMTPDALFDTLDALYDAYAHIPGFVDVYHRPDSAVAFWPTFEGVVPMQAYTVNVPSSIPVAFDVMPVMAPDRPGVTEPTQGGAGPTDLPTYPDISCTGIRPGARISSSIGICTLAFMFTDGTDVYATTAGHCVNPGGSVRLSSGTSIGNAVYSTGDGGVGRDFALIKIRTSIQHLVNPEMCFWAGPLDIHGSGIFGRILLQDGHGAGVINAPPRPKTGIGGSMGARSFAWSSATVPGDSGSPVQTDDGGVVGVHTHTAISLWGFKAGTRIDHGLALAGRSDLQLMTATDLHVF